MAVPILDRMLRRLALPAVAAGMLAMPAHASAATLYAAQGGGVTPGCPETAPCSLNAAIAQANLAQDSDAIVVRGPLTTEGGGGPVDLADSPIELLGSGRDTSGTVIRRTGSAALVVGSQSSASGVLARSDAGTVVRALAGSTLRSLTVESTGGGTGLKVTPGGSTTRLDELFVSAPNATALQVAPSSGSVTVLTSSFLSGDVGAEARGGRLVAQRFTATAARAGLFVSSGTASLAASSGIVRMAAPGATGILVGPGGAADLQQLTIDGASGGGGLNGVHVIGASAGVRGSIVRGFESDLRHDGGALSVGTSSFANTTGPVDGSPGGNLNVDPGYFDAAAGDYRLDPASPVIDRAGSEPPGGDESPSDRLGAARVLDGDGDGLAARDMGAFEVRRPFASLVFPSVASVGVPVTFQALNPSYPGGEISGYQWDLDGNGTFETNTGGFPRVTRTYTGPARLTIGLRVLGTDGASTTVSRPLVVIDRTRPRFLFAGLTNSAFAVGFRGTALIARARLTTTFRYRLSEPATVRFVIEQAVLGRRIGVRCLPALYFRRFRAPCPRYAFRGAFTRRNRVGPAALNYTPFSGRIGYRALPLGRFRASMTATDSAGHRSYPRRLFFRIVLRSARVAYR